MDWFALQGFDTWCMDMEGYGRSDKSRNINFDIANGVDDLLEFYRRLPNIDKQFAMMPGMSHASFQQINYRTVYHILHSFFTQSEPIYRG